MSYYATDRSHDIAENVMFSSSLAVGNNVVWTEYDELAM